MNLKIRFNAKSAYKKKLWSQKKLQDLELKLDNSDLRHQEHLEKIESEIEMLKMQNQGM